MLKHQADWNQGLLGRIKKLEERETEAAKNLSEQIEANHALRKNLGSLNKKLEERDSRLNAANQVHMHIVVHTLLRLSLLLANVCNLFPDCHFFEG